MYNVGRPTSPSQGTTYTVETVTTIHTPVEEQKKTNNNKSLTRAWKRIFLAPTTVSLWFYLILVLFKVALHFATLQWYFQQQPSQMKLFSMIQFRSIHNVFPLLCNYTRIPRCAISNSLHVFIMMSLGLPQRSCRGIVNIFLTFFKYFFSSIGPIFYQISMSLKT